MKVEERLEILVVDSYINLCRTKENRLNSYTPFCTPIINNYIFKKLELFKDNCFNPVKAYTIYNNYLDERLESLNNNRRKKEK